MNLKINNINDFVFSVISYTKSNVNIPFLVATRVSDGSKWVNRPELEKLFKVDFSRTKLCKNDTIHIALSKAVTKGLIPGGRIIAFISFSSAVKVCKKYSKDPDLYKIFEQTESNQSEVSINPENSTCKTVPAVFDLRVVAPSSYTVAGHALVDIKINNETVTVDAVSLFHPSTGNVTFIELAGICKAANLPEDQITILLSKLVDTDIASDLGIEFAVLLKSDTCKSTYIKAASVYPLLSGLKVYWNRLMTGASELNIDYIRVSAIQTNLANIANNQLLAGNAVPLAENNFAGIKTEDPVLERTTSNVVAVNEPEGSAAYTQSYDKKQLQPEDNKVAEKPVCGTLTLIFFEGDEVPVIEADNTRWVPISGLCTNLGIDPWTQIVKARSDERLITRDILGCDSLGRKTNLVCLNIKSVAPWLYTINPQKVAENIRPKLKVYQANLAKAIDEYVTTGIAVNVNHPMVSNGKILETLFSMLIKALSEHNEALRKYQHRIEQVINKVIDDKEQALEKAADLAEEYIKTRDELLKEEHLKAEQLKQKAEEERKVSEMARRAAEEALARESELKESVKLLERKAKQADYYESVAWCKTSTVLAPELGFASAQELHKALYEAGYIKTSELYKHVWIPTAKLVRKANTSKPLGMISRKLKAPGSEFGTNPYVYAWYWSPEGERVLREIFADRTSSISKKNLSANTGKNDKASVTTIVRGTSFESCTDDNKYE